MHNQFKPLRLEQLFDRRPVANIDRRVRKPLRLILQPFQVPQRVPGRPEKSPETPQRARLVSVQFMFLVQATSGR